MAIQNQEEKKESLKVWCCCFGSVAMVFLFFFFEATVEMKVEMLYRMWPESLGGRKPCGLRYPLRLVESKPISLIC